MLITATTEDDVASLEINVYDEGAGALFVHHDILIGEFPLCLSWTNTALGGLEVGNFVAVGWGGGYGGDAEHSRHDESRHRDLEY